jgi:uncharacterized membrane protein YbaN (DUF454 family)
MKKILLIIAGVLALGIGSIGIVLPILPTVPFLLIASICFMNSSEKLNDWFEQTKIYQNHLRVFIEKKGMTMKEKLTLLIPVNIMLITYMVIYDNLLMRLTISFLIVVKLIFFAKMKTLKKRGTM